MTCPPGMAFNSSTGISSIGMTLCKPGYYSLGGSTTGNTCTCSICSAGSSCTDPSQSPVPCDRNTYSPSAGGSSCTRCSAATYSAPGATTCISAPVGTYAPVDAGSYRICPPGFYCPAGASAPIPCPANTYGSSSGLSSSSCSGSCAPGTFCQGGFTKPLSCTVPKLANIPR